MSVILLASVGNRDLLVDGEHLPPEVHREQGQRILSAFESYRGRLAAPQIACCVAWVLERHPHLDSVVLLVTDQPESVSARHRDKDTIFVGQIIKRLLAAQFKQQVQKVRLASIASGNPAVPDEMYDEVGKILSCLPGRPEVEKCYVLPVGGPPAVSNALLLHSCRLFEARCVPLYLREGSTRPEPTDFERQIRIGLVRRMALERLRVDDYFGVENLLAEAGEEGRACRAFAAYAHRRLNFDFESARDVLEAAMPSLRGADRDLARRLLDSLQTFLERGWSGGGPQLEAERSLALIAELYHNSRITFRSGRYIEFLGRAIRFVEACSRYAVERGFGVDTDERKGRGRFQRFLQDNPALDDYLRSRSVDGGALDPARMTIPVFLAMVDYLAEGRWTSSTTVEPVGAGLSALRTPVAEKPALTDWGALAQLLRRLDRLRYLRNRSIIAHDFEGVSEEKLKAAYRDSDAEARHPLEDMQAVLRTLGASELDDVYSLIRCHLEPQLEGP